MALLPASFAAIVRATRATRSSPGAGRRDASWGPMIFRTKRSPQSSRIRATRLRSTRSIPIPTTIRPPGRHHIRPPGKAAGRGLLRGGGDSSGACGAQDVLEGNAVQVPEAVEDTPGHPDEVPIAQGEGEGLVESLARVEEPLAVAGDARTVVSSRSVDHGSEVLRGCPAPPLVVADVEVRTAEGLGSPEAPDEEKRLVRRNERLEGVDRGPVEERAHVLGRDVATVDQWGPVDVVVAGLAARGEIEGSAPGDRAENLIEPVVHRTLEEGRSSPSRALPLGGPNIEMVSVDTSDGPVRSEEQSLTVRGEHGVRVLVGSREGKDRGRRPGAVPQRGLVEDVEVVGGSGPLEVE